jgi:hypothetical protein
MVTTFSRAGYPPHAVILGRFLSSSICPPHHLHVTACAAYRIPTAYDGRVDCGSIQALKFVYHPSMKFFDRDECRALAIRDADPKVLLNRHDELNGIKTHRTYGF